MTVVVVDHLRTPRLSEVLLFDRVLFFDGGRLPPARRHHTNQSWLKLIAEADFVVVCDEGRYKLWKSRYLWAPGTEVLP